MDHLHQLAPVPEALPAPDTADRAHDLEEVTVVVAARQPANT